MSDIQRTLASRLYSARYFAPPVASLPAPPSDFRASTPLEQALMDLLPDTDEGAAQVQRAADAIPDDPERRAQAEELTDFVDENVPREYKERPVAWSVFFVVAVLLLGAAPELPDKEIAMLGVIAVVFVFIWEKYGVGGE